MNMDTLACGLEQPGLEPLTFQYPWSWVLTRARPSAADRFLWVSLGPLRLPRSRGIFVSYLSVFANSALNVSRLYSVCVAVEQLQIKTGHALTPSWWIKDVCFVFSTFVKTCGVRAKTLKRSLLLGTFRCQTPLGPSPVETTGAVWTWQLELTLLRRWL